MTRRRKKLTVEQMRAMADPKDYEMMSKWKGSTSDIIEQKVNCIVCGQPNLMVVLRTNVPFVVGAKYLCFDCTDAGWAWMGNLCAEDPAEAQQRGTVIESSDVSTLEKNAKRGGDYLEANGMLFGSRKKVQTTNQNPTAAYKPIREFEDDTLLLHLSKCKHPKDIDEGKTWELWIDKNAR